MAMDRWSVLRTRFMLIRGTGKPKKRTLGVKPLGLAPPTLGQEPLGLAPPTSGWKSISTTEDTEGAEEGQ